MQCSLIHINTEDRELIDVWGSVRRASSLVQPGCIEVCTSSTRSGLKETAVERAPGVWTRASSRSVADMAVLVIQAQCPVRQRHRGATFHLHATAKRLQIGEAAAATDDAGDRLDNTCDGVSLRYPAVVRVMSRYAVAKGHWVVGGVAPPLPMSPRRPRYSSAAHLKLCRTQTKRCSVKQDSSVSFFYKQTDIKAQTSFLFSLFFF